MSLMDAIKSKKASKCSVSDTMKKMDMYGEKFSLTFRGDKNFRTYPGTIISICVLVTLISFISYKL
jgi:hypothetical protein